MRLRDLDNLENVSLDFEVKDDKHRVRDIFCEHWAQSKKGLHLASLMVKNPIVKLIITIVMNIGDGISEKICGGTE